MVSVSATSWAEEFVVGLVTIVIDTLFEQPWEKKTKMRKDFEARVTQWLWIFKNCSDAKSVCFNFLVVTEIMSL